MRYYRYEVHFLIVKGTDLLIADTLSRAHQDDSGNEQGDHTRIMNVCVFGDILDKRLDEIREATLCDASLQSVMKLVLEGWPADKRETPVCAPIKVKVVGSIPTLVRVFLCPCVGPIPSVGLMLTCSMG